MSNQELAKRLKNARIQAALKLQHLCWDAAQGDRTPFMNRDRAMDVVDAIVIVVMETFQQYLIEEKKDAANNQ